MDVQHYRQREQSERALAAQAPTPEAREIHLELADSYRAVIDAYERLQSLRDEPSALTG